MGAAPSKPDPCPFEPPDWHMFIGGDCQGDRPRVVNTGDAHNWRCWTPDEAVGSFQVSGCGCRIRLWAGDNCTGTSYPAASNTWKYPDGIHDPSCQHIQYASMSIDGGNIYSGN
ncbi:Uu.00g079990.m01.CDS01 [Anthostomella pinea]|uniref:Uu.00g079990.m01.CDS01 n=1 Tax=Anthostomella pinea TaxID=933095 RepID=A0AAI8YJE4_9PEZI|nr:Uu.00g079990.m01.CDS01 [Anthostomella pinea]